MLPFKFTAHFIELDICCIMKSYFCHLHPVVQLRESNSWLKSLLERLQMRMFAVSHSVVSCSLCILSPRPVKAEIKVKKHILYFLVSKEYRKVFKEFGKSGSDGKK